MGKHSESDLDAIIREKMPGYHLARRRPSAPSEDSDAPATRSRPRRAAPESATPSISDLRSKYLGGSDAGEATSDMLADVGEEAEIVTVEPDSDDDELRHAKSVVISSDGDILGAQG